jgi:hypothetical protein
MTSTRAGIAPRFAAAVIDGLLACVPIMLAFMVGLFVADVGDPARARGAAAAVMRLLPLWVLVYFGTEAVVGWTLGKRANGCVVRAASGERASLPRLLLRWVLKYGWFPIGPGLKAMGRADAAEMVTFVTWAIVLVGFLTVLGPGRRALWDMLAGTAVFVVSKPAATAPVVASHE